MCEPSESQLGARPILKEPAAREEGVDAESTDGGRTLRIQVTRAERTGPVWLRLRADGAVAGSLSVPDAVEALRLVIEQKARKTALPQRSELVLALDTVDTASYAMAPVVDALRIQFGSWARALGYESIWVVGPNVRLTARLDALDAPDGAA